MTRYQILDRVVASGERRDPGFDVVVAFDYYDGPEKGVAIFSNGGAVKFESIGESKSGCFRAFYLAPLEGDDWLLMVRRMPEAGDGALPRMTCEVSEERLETLRSMLWLEAFREVHRMVKKKGRES